jgi:8-oxo-dGTP diphosphatase
MTTHQQYPRVGSGGVILDEQGRIALVHRINDPEAATWSIPGGKVELYETVEEALVREIREELGVETEIDRLLCISNFIDRDHGVHWVSPIYLLRLLAGEIRNMEPDKARQVGWFALDDLPHPLAQFTQVALASLRPEGR